MASAARIGSEHRHDNGTIIEIGCGRVMAGSIEFLRPRRMASTAPAWRRFYNRPSGRAPGRSHGIERRTTYASRSGIRGGTCAFGLFWAARSSGWRRRRELRRSSGKVLASWNFDRDLAASADGFVARQNNPTKAMAEWKVVADPNGPTPPNVLSVQSGQRQRHLQLLLAEGTTFKDSDVRVKVRGQTASTTGAAA